MPAWQNTKVVLAEHHMPPAEHNGVHGSIAHPAQNQSSQNCAPDHDCPHQYLSNNNNVYSGILTIIMSTVVSCCLANGNRNAQVAAG